MLSQHPESGRETSEREALDIYQLTAGRGFDLDIVIIFINTIVIFVMVIHLINDLLFRQSLFQLCFDVYLNFVL